MGLRLILKYKKGKLSISHHVSDLSSECFFPCDDANFLLAVKVLVELLFFVFFQRLCELVLFSKSQQLQQCGVPFKTHIT